MSIKKSIGWTDMTINPIKGRCKGGCWYCFYSGKGGMLNRFKLDPKIRFRLKPFYNLPNKSKKIFLCSTHDLFGSWVFSEWQDMIFEYIEFYPQHIFQILTKFPQNIDREMPENVHLGVTVTKDEDWWRAEKLQEKSTKAKIKFLSLEPLFERVFLKTVTYIDWIIIGKLTGYGNKYDPPKDWLLQYVGSCAFWNKPLFMKDNLKEIWRGELIQEMPE